MPGIKTNQFTVTTAGTAVQGPASPLGRTFYLSAHPSNTGAVWVGDDGAGAVSNANGFPLLVDARPIEVNVPRSLADLWFDADTNGNSVCWSAV